jgi:hypothetical protein
VDLAYPRRPRRARVLGVPSEAMGDNDCNDHRHYDEENGAMTDWKTPFDDGCCVSPAANDAAVSAHVARACLTEDDGVER